MGSEKSPVLVLEEIVKNDKIVPQYTQWQLPSAPNGKYRVFCYSVTVDKVDGFGLGPTDKSAKEEAAKDALGKYTTLVVGIPMTDLTVEDATSSSSSSVANMKKDLKIALDLQVDAVLLLATFTKERKLSHPEYRLVSEMGPANRRKFTMECRVGCVRKSASDYSKNKAKQVCANEVYKCMLSYIPKSDPKFPKNYTKKVSDYSKTLVSLMRKKKVSYNDLWAETGLLDVNLDVKFEELLVLPNLTENNLRIFLKKLGLTYTIESIDSESKSIFGLTIQSNPVFSVCKISNRKEKALPFLLRDIFSLLRIMTRASPRRVT